MTRRRPSWSSRIVCLPALPLSRRWEAAGTLNNYQASTSCKSCILFRIRGLPIPRGGKRGKGIAGRTWGRGFPPIVLDLGSAAYLLNESGRKASHGGHGGNGGTRKRGNVGRGWGGWICQDPREAGLYQQPRKTAGRIEAL